MLSLDNLSMRFGKDVLFQGVSLRFQKGRKYGLVGANGSGKTSLLKIIAGDVTPESGAVHIAKGMHLGFLRQDQALYDDEGILNTVMRGNPPLWKALHRKEILLQTEEFDLSHSDELAHLEEIIAHHNGYAAESTAAMLLEGLGIKENVHHQPLKTLSGGYKLRVLLAQLFFGNPDAILLDEPTNYLDILSIRWLEGYLQQFKGTLLICSHDRDFLNKTCDAIADIDYGTVTIYDGHYDDFIEAKSLAREHKEAMLSSQDKKKEHMQQFVDRFRAKASKARQAQSRMRMIEKLEGEMSALALLPSSRQYPHLRFSQCRASGYEPLAVADICKSFGDKQVLKEVSFAVERGDRVAIIGPNGIGKSTLLEIIVGRLTSDAGSCSWGFETHFSYFPQEHYREVANGMTVLDWLWQFDSQATQQQVRSVLGQVLFTGDDVNQRANTLSGGELARLFLARMMLVKHNILIFDEPTNHLDLESIDALTAALKDYKGTVLFVSHNVYFIKEIANRIIEISPTGILDYRGSYDEYLAIADVDHLRPSSPSKAKEKGEAPVTPSEKDQLARRKQRNDKNRLSQEITQLEERSQELEKKIAAIEERLAEPLFYTDTPKSEQEALLKEKNALQRNLEDTLLAWEQKMQQ